MDNIQPSKKNEQGKRVGIIGGTFDPIHFTHLHMAEVVRLECQLDEIWFMPAKLPPHKQEQKISSAKDRITMIEKAITGIPYFDLSLIEFEREGPSYTVETIKSLTKTYPATQFFFIIGADMVEDLPNWYQIDDLVKVITFIGVGRPGWELDAEHAFTKNVKKVEMVPSHIASTLIREQRRKKKSIRFLVPDSVYHYIEEKRLYE
jgi:nicotinate-nucleotide adenylyltransferase